MPVYTRPDTYAVELQQSEGPVRPTAVGLGGMQAVTKKGPLGVVTRTRTYPAWERIYGGKETRGDAAYEAELFFNEGGFELLTVRQGHFSDVDDITSYTGGVANKTSITEGVAATAAAKTTSAAPFNCEPGDSFTLDIDNGGLDTITFDAAQATRAGSGLAIVDISTETLILKIDGGDTQTITFGAQTTVATAVAHVNDNNLLGGSAVVNGAEMDIVSDTRGTGSSVEIVGGTALTELGHSAGTATGTGDVADINAITAQEFHDLVEADTSSTIAVVNANSTVTLTSPTTTTSSELDFAGSVLTPFGLTTETINGTDAGATYDTLKLEAGYHGTVSPGTDGNNLKKLITQNAFHPTRGAGLDLAADATAADTYVQVTTLDGLNVNSVIKIWDGTNTEYKQVDGLRTVVTAGVATFFADLTAGLTNSFLAAAAQIESSEFDVALYEGTTLVETKTGCSMLDTADNYVETVFNDENTGSEYAVATDLDAACGIGADTPATDSSSVALTGGTDETTSIADTDWVGSATGGTGLYAWDTVREFMPICTPGNNNAGLVHSAAAYCASRMFFEYIAYVTNGTTVTNAVAYRKNTLGVDSSYVSLYAGGVKVFDSAGSGSNPQRSITGVGAMMGLRSRVDSLPSPNGGPWQSPAGEGDYGTIKTAQDVVTDYSDSDHGTMNDAHINVIRKHGTNNPVIVDGSRTLDSSAAQRFRYINVRRFFQYVEKSVADSTRWAVHRNNDFRLWSRLKIAIDAWLGGLIPDGAFPTADKSLAYYILSGVTDGVMTQDDIDSGRYKGKIGLAPNKPGEFIIFEFTQYDSGYDVTE